MFTRFSEIMTDRLAKPICGSGGQILASVRLAFAVCVYILDAIFMV